MQEIEANGRLFSSFKTILCHGQLRQCQLSCIQCRRNWDQRSLIP